MKILSAFLRKTFIAAFLFLSFGYFCPEVSAQLSFFSAGKSRERTDAPTYISSDTMDIDIENNIATLLGNVEVDDQDLNIKCNKMVIYLEEKNQKKSDSGAAASDSAGKGLSGEKKEESGPDVGDPGDNKQLSRIECIGDVVITRKIPAGSVEEEQKAIAGKAVYDLIQDTITLYEKPVLIKGRDRLVGDRVILHPKSGKVEIIKGKITTLGGLDKAAKDSGISAPGQEEKASSGSLPGGEGAAAQ